MKYKEGDKVIGIGTYNEYKIDKLKGELTLYFSRRLKSRYGTYRVRFPDRIWNVPEKQLKLQEVTDWRARMTK